MTSLNKYGFTEREMEYLAPKPIRRMNRISRINFIVRVVGILFVIFAIAFVAARTMYPFNYHAQAAEQVVVKNGQEFKIGSFCAQAILDHDSYGRDLSQSLKDYCNI